MSDFSTIMFIICMGFLIITTTVVIILEINSSRMIKQQQITHELMIAGLKNQLQEFTKVDNSREILVLIIQLATHIASCEFQNFIDTHHLKKATRANIKDLVKRVAQRTRDAVNVNEINSSETYFSDVFIDNYIIDICTKLIKDLLAKEVIEIIEEEG